MFETIDIFKVLNILYFEGRAIIVILWQWYSKLSKKDFSHNTKMNLAMNFVSSIQKL